MKTFAIGDLHGHFDQFIKLYDQLLAAGLRPEKDRLIFLGDIVDGGPQTKQVIDWLMDYEKKYPQTVVLTGNHEQLMLDALVFNGRVYGSYDLWWNQGGKQTYESYVADSGLTQYEKAISQVKDHIPVEHLNWLRTRPFYYEIEGYFFVHAGIPNKTSLDEFKKGIDNNDIDMQRASVWIRDEFLMSIKDWGKKIIFGHTVFPHRSFEGTNEEGNKTRKIGYPFIMENKIGIDGMCHDSGNLIALEIPGEVFYYEVG